MSDEVILDVFGVVAGEDGCDQCRVPCRGL